MSSYKTLLSLILFPTPVISAQHASKVVVSENGKTYTGVLGLGSTEDLVMLEGLLDDLVPQKMNDIFRFLDELPASSVSTGRGPCNGKLC